MAYDFLAANAATIVATVSLLPEILVGSIALIFLIGGVYAANKRTDRMIHGLGLFVLVTLLGMMVWPSLLHVRITLFSQMFVSDAFSHFSKMLLILGTAFTFMLSSGGLTGKGDGVAFEFPVLILLSLLGMLVMVSANDLLSLYIGLELSSLPLYVLAAFDRDQLKATESGLKYFVLGALASGLMLFGISLIYGFTGATGFEPIGTVLSGARHVSPGIVVGLVLLIVGFSFKISAAPFHMWTPDVYEGAPTPVTAFFAMAPKFAAFALFVRLLEQPFLHLLHDWRQVVIIVSVLSMLVGALGAMTQTNLKRLLAYGSIGHAGYAMIGLAAGNTDGVSGILIYFTLYVIATAGAFAVIMMMKRGGEMVETIPDLAGLSKTSPGLAFALSVLMFSMAGIPPFSGFFAKLYIFLAAVHAGLITLAVIGVVISVIACFYYLKIVKVMYFDEPAAPFDTDIAAPIRWTLVFSTFVTACFIFLPSPLIALARSAAEGLLR